MVTMSELDRGVFLKQIRDSLLVFLRICFTVTWFGQTRGLDGAVLSLVNPLRVVTEEIVVWDLIIIPP